MEISKIDIEVKVEGLKNIKVITNQGDVDANAEFDMLGVSPLEGASMMIGNHELFCKRIHQPLWDGVTPICPPILKA